MPLRKYSPHNEPPVAPPPTVQAINDHRKKKKCGCGK